VGAGVRVGVGAGVGVKGRGCRRNLSTAPYPHAADCLLGAGPGGSVGGPSFAARAVLGRRLFWPAVLWVKGQGSVPGSMVGASVGTGVNGWYRGQWSVQGSMVGATVSTGCMV
jgi:hypothetical protein